MIFLLFLRALNFNFNIRTYGAPTLPCKEGFLLHFVVRTFEDNFFEWRFYLVKILVFLPVTILIWMSPVNVCARNVVPFYGCCHLLQYLLWMLSPALTIFYYGCCLLLQYLLWMLSPPFTIFYYGCCLLLQYFTIDVVSFTIFIWMLSPRLLQFLIWLLSPSFTSHKWRHIPYSGLNLYCFFVQVYQLLNENYVEGGTYSA